MSYSDAVKENGFYDVLGGAFFQRKSEHPYKNSSGMGIRNTIYIAYVLVLFLFLGPYLVVLGGDYSDNVLKYEKGVSFLSAFTFSILYVLFYSTYRGGTSFMSLEKLVETEKKGARSKIFSGLDYVTEKTKKFQGPVRKY